MKKVLWLFLLVSSVSFSQGFNFFLPASQQAHQSSGAFPIISVEGTPIWKADDNPIVLAKGTNFQSGDGAVVLVGGDFNNVTTEMWPQSAAPSGFTQHHSYGDATSDNHLGMYYKVIDGSEGPDFTVAVNGLAQGTWAVLLRVQGINVTNMIEAISTFTSGFGTSLTVTGLSSTVDNSVAICYCGTDGSDMKDPGDPNAVPPTFGFSGTDWQEVVLVEDPSAGTNGNSNGKVYRNNRATAGPVPDITPTWSNSDGNGCAVFYIRSQ